MIKPLELLPTASTLNELWARQSGTQIQRGQRNAIKYGRWITVAPLGYQNVRRQGVARIEIDPHVALLIQQAFYLAAEGKRSLRKILYILTERGLRSRREKPLTVAVLHKILTNPFYVGKMRFQGELHQGMHRPLIEDGTFEKVRHNLAKRQKG